MGKAARNRRQRQPGRPQRPGRAAPPGTLPGATPQDHGTVGPFRGGSPEAQELLEQIWQDTEMPCRATYLDDPIFGSRLAPVTSMSPAGELLTDPSARLDQIPVLLFEPARSAMVRDPSTGRVHELRTEVMVSTGFHRVPTRFVIGGLPADGWGVYRVPDGVVLRDGDGAVRAEGRLTLDPEWVSAAASCRSVLVFFGPKLGIRVVPGSSPYTDKGRAEEFTRGRREGSLLVAAVKWRGLLEEAVEWVLFSEGSFGLRGPVAYVPSWHFRPFGGPAAFGFESMSRLGKEPVEIPAARGLVAELTPTDMDLTRPDMDADLSLITGYHAPPGEPEFAAWRAQVLRHRQVVVVTGRRPMPFGPGAPVDQAFDVLRESQAARIPLTPVSLRLAGGRPPDPPVFSAPGLGSAAAELEEMEEYSQILTEKIRTQCSYTVDVADAVAELIDLDYLWPWVTNLWPVVCQTCREPIGATADVSADGPIDGGKVLISLHHSACRPSGITPEGGVTMHRPTSSFAAGCIGDLANPGRSDIPVMVINPSCEQLLLARQDTGSWRNATLDDFAALGLIPGPGKSPPLIRRIQAEMSEGRLDVCVTADLPALHRWVIEPADHVCEQIGRYAGFAVAVTTKALPALLAPEELPGAFSDPEALTGWVQLARPPCARRQRAGPRARSRDGR
jgi:hypothetical protein